MCEGVTDIRFTFVESLFIQDTSDTIWDTQPSDMDWERQPVLIHN